MASGALFPCFANDHGHAPGFGSHHFEGVLEMADRVRRRYPNKILYGEGIFEGYVDSIQESYSIEPSFFHEETLVPLFAAVYHGYTSLHEWPVYVKSQGLHVPSFAAALAAAVHLGHKVGSFQSLVTWDALVEGAGYPTRVGQCEDSPASNQTACGYLQDLVEMKFQTMDVLDYGERLRDPTTDSPTHTVSWYHSSAFPEPPSNHVRPVIEASLWASLTTPERKLLLLS